jgi:carbamoyltransferase
MNGTTVLGVYQGHDFGACLMRNGRVLCMIEEERLTRYRHGLPASFRDLPRRFCNSFAYLPWASIQYCLQMGGLGIDELDALVLPGHLRGLRHMLPIRDDRKLLFADQPVGGTHHFWHALSAFLASPFERAAVLIVDGDGEVTPDGYEAESGYLFENRQGQCSLIFKNRYPVRSPESAFRAGIGWTYEYASMLLGFGNPELEIADAGKTMGLAPYGEPHRDFQEPWIEREGFTLQFGGFHRWLERTGHARRFKDGQVTQPIVLNEEHIDSYAKNLAFKVQSETEAALLGLAQALQEQTGAEHLCFGGGVAMNCVANGQLQAKSPFRKVYVPPAPADNGLAMGLAFYGHLALSPQTPIEPVRSASLGKRYDDQIVSLLQATGLSHRAFASDTELADAAARDLASGRILGWFQGASEVGPRALGHRSILADPRVPDIKDTLNSRVKFREGFRPFAPSVLAEHVGAVFDFDGESPHMSFIAPVKPHWRSRIPGVVHVDGTARIQTVSQRAEPLYHQLIDAFRCLTEVPLVLNTSFNLRGMPIVETPAHALSCFLYTEMDVLYLGRCRIEPPALAELELRVSPGWSLHRELRAGQVEATVLRGPQGKESSFASREGWTAELVAMLAGDTPVTLERALLAARGEIDPTSEAVSRALVRLLLRRGALTLRCGDVWL